MLRGAWSCVSKYESTNMLWSNKSYPGMQGQPLNFAVLNLPVYGLKYSCDSLNMVSEAEFPVTIQLA